MLFNTVVISYDELKEFDNVKDPKSLKELVSVTGADAISYPEESVCCAGFAQPIDRDLSLGILMEKLDGMTKVGADCLVVVCPYCFLQFDLGQIACNQRFNKKYQIPVLYYPQLLGLAMGFNSKELGLEFHKVKADKVVENLKSC